MAQPRIGLLVIDLGGPDQAIDLCAGGGALGRITEQPGFVPDNKRLIALSAALLSIGKNQRPYNAPAGSSCSPDN
ncbi:hypothetical protein D3C77_250240 [compost metagenome]